VHTQRAQKRLLEKGKKSNLTPSRQKALEDLGFTWSQRKVNNSDRSRESWDTRLAELVEYKNKFGTCNVRKLIRLPSC